MLILAALADGAKHGYQLGLDIETASDGNFRFKHGTLYPILHNLEKQGLIEGSWEHPDRRTRRFYAITPAGRKEYRRLRKELKPFLDSMIRSVTLIEREIYGDQPGV